MDLELQAKVEQSPLFKGARIALLKDVQATDADGNLVQLSAKAEFEFAAPSAAKIFAGTRVVLVKALQPTPDPRSTFALSTKCEAAFATDTQIELLGVTKLNRPGGDPVSIPAATVVLAAGERVELAAGTKVTLLRRRMRPADGLYAEFFESYKPNRELVRQPDPAVDLDFSSGGAYTAYNWELFFHVPITVAMHLSKNQRYAEAQRWFHYLFDPTDDSAGPAPERFWKVRPFQSTDVKKAEEILVNLATGADPDLRKDTLNSIQAWQEAPFRPHVIARYRQQAYMLKTVMAYLDNLIEWGDSLFRQDTGEAIDEATQLYVLAANILGPRPQPVPKKGAVRPQNYANLRKDLKQFGVVLRDMEADMLFDLVPAPTSTGDGERLNAVRSMGKALYFCVPRNDKLLGYWDTVADRLFKIRNSLNLQGVFRRLALFEPPIDPALLARAAAAGLDVGAVVSGLNQPLPLVRFQFLVQKATELAQEVKSLGNSLLSAMEKEDGESMAILRAKHERAVLEMVEHVRYAQWQEAIKAREGLLQTLALAVQRYTYYERQLGKQADEIEKAIPDLGTLDSDGLEKMKFAMQEPAVTPREIEVDIAQDLGSSGGKITSSYETRELNQLASAQTWREVAQYARLGAQAIAPFPDFNVDFHFWGIGGASKVGGGAKLSQVASFAADVATTIAEGHNYDAGTAAKVGSYARREQDWAFQSNLAAGEITQIFKQLRAAQIREAIAEKEWHNHQQQIKNAQEIEFFLTGEKNAAWTHKIDSTEKKTTNRALYAWMKREVKSLYSQCFQFAFDMARKAERALQHELGKPDTGYLQFGYLAGKEGLLAGEKLYLDLKRMEMAYHDQNQREYELTKHVSLLQVAPLALIQLRETGRCTVRLPEEIFDMDGPGHYFRRIKTVAISIPCVAGPYTSVNCTLTLLKSRIRTTPILGDDDYARTGDEDGRFSDHFGSLQSIVTSSAQNDGGLFETNLRDERYLPFENSGVIGEWQLQLPADPGKKDPVQFDYNTISDVILHLRYTAREGGGLLRNAAMANFTAFIQSADAVGTTRLFSVCYEFPSEWAKFQNQTPAAGKRYELALTLRDEHYPFWSRNHSREVRRVEILVRSIARPALSDVDIFTSVDANDDTKKGHLSKVAAMGGLLSGPLENATQLKAVGDFKLFFASKAMSDIWIAVTWGSVEPE